MTRIKVAQAMVVVMALVMALLLMTHTQLMTCSQSCQILVWMLLVAVVKFSHLLSCLAWNTVIMLLWLQRLPSRVQAWTRRWKTRRLRQLNLHKPPDRQQQQRQHQQQHHHQPLRSLLPRDVLAVLLNV
jgi:cell division protein FtsW (lipid II flippase)